MSIAATLLVDASWCPNTKVVGVGYWIASDKGKSGGSLALDDQCATPTLAEMIAICEVVRQAKKASVLRFKDRFVIQTDCLAAISALKHLRHSSPQEFEVVTRFEKLTKGMFPEFRHVKARSDENGPRFKAQTICDFEARKAMRFKRQKVLNDNQADARRKSI